MSHATGMLPKAPRSLYLRRLAPTTLPQRGQQAKAPWPASLGLAWLWPLAILLGGCVTPKQFGGPVPFRNQHPAQLTALRMDPQSARPLPKGNTRLRVDLAYSSIFLEGTGSGNSWFMDGEILRSGLKVRHGLGHGLEVWGELAMALTGPGFLDDFVENWHDAFGLPNQNRDQFPKDVWRVEAQKGGVTAWEMDRTDGALLDLPLGLNWNFVPMTAEQPWALTARVATELPTGNQERGFGSGGFDWSLGMVGEYRYEAWSFTAHAQHTFVHTPDPADRAGLDFRDVTSAGVGAETALAEHTFLLMQILFDTSTLRQLDFDRVSDPQWTLWFGLRHHMGERFAVEVGFGEDLSTDGPPDFTAWLAFIFELGGGED